MTKFLPVKIITPKTDLTEASSFLESKVYTEELANIERQIEVNDEEWARDMTDLRIDKEEITRRLKAHRTRWLKLRQKREEVERIAIPPNRLRTIRRDRLLGGYQDTKERIEWLKEYLKKREKTENRERLEKSLGYFERKLRKLSYLLFN